MKCMKHCKELLVRELTLLGEASDTITVDQLVDLARVDMEIQKLTAEGLINGWGKEFVKGVFGKLTKEHEVAADLLITNPTALAEEIAYDVCDTLIYTAREELIVHDNEDGDECYNVAEVLEALESIENVNFY